MAIATKVSPVKIETITREVVLRGTADLMFDRYAGDNDTKLEPHQKLYYRPGTKELVMPSLNLMSFLSAHNTNSAPKRLLDKRKYKDVANACLSFVQISPTLIPITRNGEPLVFGKFDGDVDADTGIYIHRSVARLDKGIPNPKERPTLPTPWELSFALTIIQNKEIQETQILNLIESGGVALGLGTFRGVFGKFAVDKWE